MILGNDIAGGRIVPMLEVLDKPLLSHEELQPVGLPSMFPHRASPQTGERCKLCRSG